MHHLLRPANHRLLVLGLTLLTSATLGVQAQGAEADDPQLPLIGKIRPRAAREIASSTWSIGGETLDRDFAVYENYKKYLGPLGAKGLRLQAGWAKCEKQRGTYDWSWLDPVVDDALSQGVQPWLELSYGNSIYPNGGGTGLGGGLPKSPEALAAWDNWVRAIVGRYKNRVREWEIWNEPDLGPSTPQEYADFFIRTAEIIRAEHPQGRIYALALAHKVPYAEAFLERVREQDKLALVDAITFHTYPNNPDDTRNVDQLRAIIAKTGRPIEVRQGETGATSKYQENFALKKLPMTEIIQAKWNLRRMLAHHGKDVPFNLFTLMDLHYRWNGKIDMNYKGLLASKEDQTVAYEKPAYFAAQHVFSIFDGSLARVAGLNWGASVSNSMAVYAHTNKTTGAQVVTLWLKGAMPGNSNQKTLVDLRLAMPRSFNNPILADLLTGHVYAFTNRIEGQLLKQVPVYDSPVVIADQSVLPISFAARAGQSGK